MKLLKIQNLILIERTEIAFGPGLNILTGETGSGKSAILSAIRLIAGERADATLIQKGAEFAIVEAILEGDVFVRREIHRSGKNRCFLDDQQVSLAQLKEKVDIEMVDQSNSWAVLEDQTKMIDAFASIVEEVEQFEESKREERKAQEELEKLLQTPKERELDWATKDLALIEEAEWQAGEEVKLEEEHHFLTHAQELAQTMSSIAFAFNEGVELPSLKRILTQLEHLVPLDQKLKEIAQTMKSALLELEEVGRSVQNEADRIEADPARLAVVEKRLATIESLKRRFGPDIASEKTKLQQTLDRLASLDEAIGALRGKIQGLVEKNQDWKKRIDFLRSEAAPHFCAKVLEELKALNIPHAQFEVETPNIRFLFSANPGLNPMPLELCASGGELSRLLLAIKTILSGGASTLVFDEIDSNVGGQTAAILGQKLQKLASKRQVICVTHFVQVAKCAGDHFLVSKSAQDGVAKTSVKKMSEKEREMEYGRMLGTET